MHHRSCTTKLLKGWKKKENQGGLACSKEQQFRMGDHLSIILLLGHTSTFEELMPKMRTAKYVLKKIRNSPLVNFDGDRI